jgi:Helix-turn-helix domain
MDDLDELLTTEDYARVRRCSPRTVERERTSGAGCKFIKIGRGVRYRRRDVFDFIERHLRQNISQACAA